MDKLHVGSVHGIIVYWYVLTSHISHDISEVNFIDNYMEVYMES